MDFTLLHPRSLRARARRVQSDRVPAFSSSRSRARRRPRPGLAAGLGLAGALALAPATARAEADPFVMVLQATAEALSNLNFYSQVQAGLFAVSADDLRPGGIGARVVGNGQGFGLSLGAEVERYRAGVGGLALVDFEFRPLPFLRKNIYRVVDPFAIGGLEIGGGALGFRATQTIGAGVDLGLFGRPDTNRESVHPVFSIRYLFRPWQVPGDLPQHLVLVGASTRIVF